MIQSLVNIVKGFKYPLVFHSLPIKLLSKNPAPMAIGTGLIYFLSSFHVFPSLGINAEIITFVDK